MAESAATPVRVGVVSAGGTRMVDAAAGRNVTLREDPAGADAQDDIGLLGFLTLLTALAGSWAGLRPLEFAILGGVQTRPLARAAMARLIALEADLVVFWTFSPLALPGAPEGDAAFDELAAEAVRREVAVVFPAATGFGARCAGLIGCGGVLARAPYLDALTAPAGWPDRRPLVSSWADWATMRAAWVGAADLGEALPETIPFPVGLSPPVWSVAAMLALMQAVRPERAALAAQIEMLKLACAPVAVRPDALTPVLGFLDPRLLDTVSLQARRRDAAT